MKIKNTMPKLLGALLLMSQVSFGQTFLEDFSSGSGAFNSDYPETNNQNNSPNVGEFGIVTTSVWGGVTGDGEFMMIDGFGASGSYTVWELATPFQATTTDLTFKFLMRTRPSTTGVIANLDIELVNNATQNVVYSENRTEGAMTDWEEHSVNFNCSVGTFYTVRIVQNHNGTNANDFFLDNIEMCLGLPDPDFTINNNSESPITICDATDINLNITMNPNADNYFIGIRDLTTGIEHMRWLDASEINASNLSNFDLVQFAYNPAQSELDPYVASSGMDLIPGRCYQVSVVFQNECTVWAPSSQTICIEEECSISANYDIDGECNPIGFSASGGPGTRFFWDFGDGTSSTFQNPTHQYADPGTYSVSLLVYEVTECGTCCDVVNFSLIVDCGEFNGETMTWGAREGRVRSPGDNNSTGDLNVFPNPTNNRTTVSFELNREETVNLQVYSSTGKLVSTLMNKEVSDKGIVSVNIETKDLANGIYHVVLSTDTDRKTTSFVVGK